MPQTQSKNIKSDIKNSIVTLSFKLHSIVLLVGPDCAGKSEFALRYLIPSLKNLQTGKKKITIAYLNFDEISQELIGNSLARKNEPEILQVSEQANDILLNQLKNLTSYPVNIDFIIVDANGLDSDFRTQILNIGTENHYNVSALIFDFPNKAEYCAADGREASPKQLKDLRRTLSGGISKKEYGSIQTIDSKNFLCYEIIIEDYVFYDQYILPEGPEYVIFGDIHGCLDEFIQLLKLNGFEIGADNKVTHPEGKKVVLVGDIVDKGYAIFEVIEFVHANLDVFYMAIGNHENFVYKVLKGILTKGEIATAEVRAEFFNTISLLEEPMAPKEPRKPTIIADEHVNAIYEQLLQEYNEALDKFNQISAEEIAKRKEVREKFFAIFEAMKAFFVHRDFVITHAPCEKKYLGKISSDALRAARDYKYPKTRDYKSFSEFIFAFDERAAFLRLEAREAHPMHIYGHVMTKDVSRFKNKLAIDTGCVAGGKLTSVIIKNNRVFSQSVPIIDETKIHKTELYNFFEKLRDGNNADN